MVEVYEERWGSIFFSTPPPPVPEHALVQMTDCSIAEARCQIDPYTYITDKSGRGIVNRVLHPFEVRYALI